MNAVPDFQVTVSPGLPWPLLLLGVGSMIAAAFLRRPTWARWALLTVGAVLIVGVLLL